MLLAAPAAPSLAASTLYVDGSNPACSNSGPGTETQPLCSIKTAASIVSAGQTVQVAAGTYSEAVTISRSGTSSAPIVFTAAPGARVTLTGGASGFTVSSASWVTVNGFTVTTVSGYGISVSNSSRITVSNNEVSYTGQPASGLTRAGIRLSAVTDSVVSGNSSHHNSDYGILLTNTSTGNEVRANLTFNNAEQYQRAAAGIRLYASPGNTVAGNISHHNEDSGIESYPGSNDTLLYNNVTYDNGDHGIDNYKTTGQRVIANSVYRNVTAGINVEGGSTGATVANNISVDNGIRSPRTHSNIRVEAGSTSGTTMDNDLVQLTTPDTMLIWNSTAYSSLAAFQAATGQEAHGLQADPRWKSPTTGDFRLTAGSPGIDSANSGVSGQPSTDVEGVARFDDPDTVNTGLGPRAYDDRGAYEFGGVVGPPPDSPPAASLVVTSPSPQSLDVTADASASTDTDATPIASYSFDFGDGTAVVGPQAQATAPHTYSAPGTYTVAVTVTDTADLSSVATTTVEVGAPDPPPPPPPVNLVGNPGFETDLFAWNTSGSGSNISLTRVSGGHSGGWAAKLTNTGTTASTAALNDSPDWAKPSSAGTYTGTLWVRSDSAGATLKLRFREYNAGTLVGSVTATATLTTSWQQVTVSYSPQSPGSSTLDFNAYVSSAAPGTAFYADDAAIFLN